MSEISKDEPAAIVTVDSDRLVQRIVFFSVVSSLFLVVADAFVNYGKLIDVDAIRRLCNITREDGLANWFSSTLTLASAVFLWLIYLRVKATACRWTARGWGIIALFFTFMAVDDASKLHERVGTAVKVWLGDDSGLVGTFPSYTWQLVFVPLFAAVGLFMLIFLWRQLGTRNQRLLVFGGLALYAIAVVLDFVEGLEDRSLYETIMRQLSASRYTVEHFSKSLEEFLEMIGTTLFLAAFARKFTRLGERLHLRFR